MANHQAPAYRTAEEVLDRTLDLFNRADRELTRGLADTPNEDVTARLWRAQTYSLVAAAGARVAHALYTAELVAADRRRDAILTADPDEMAENLDEILGRVVAARTQRQQEEQGGAWDGPEPRDG